MKENQFSIGDVFRSGWEGWKKHWGLLIILLIISILLAGIPHLIFGGVYFSNGGVYFSDSEESYQSIWGQLIGFLLATYASLGMVNVTLKIAREKEVSFKDYFNTFSYYIPFLLNQILFQIILIIGFILLIIPGVIFLLKYYFSPYYVVDKGRWPLDTFRASNKAVYGSKWDLLLFIVIAFFINILGLLCLGIGIFVTIPIVAIAQAAIYVKLDSQVSAEIAQGQQSTVV